jgi:CTP-dependent riboflavin kinase
VSFRCAGIRYLTGAPKAHFILIPYRDNVENNYDKRVLEIATDIKLRDAYHLEDGDLVQIEVQDWMTPHEGQPDLSVSPE